MSDAVEKDQWADLLCKSQLESLLLEGMKTLAYENF